MSGLTLATGSARAALSERKDDLYQTPPEAVHSLLREEALPPRIWECACGPGAIARELRAAGHEVVATDLVDYQSPDQNASGRDFLMAFEPEADCIVTNPPFKNADAFVAHALTLCPRVVMLLRLAFMESERRRPILDSGSLARVLVYRKRLPMMHREGWEGKKGNSAMAFAWFVWDRDHTGPTELRRISWETAE